MKVNGIFDILNGFAPVATACDWDNCGLVIGDGEAEVTGVYVTLDADRFALDMAQKSGCNLVVSHHPIIFSPMSCITAEDTVYDYLRAGVSVISMHTCLDGADGGVNDLFAAALKMKEPERVLLEGAPLARLGDVDCEDADRYIDEIKAALGSERADYIVNGKISRVLSVSGSGGSALGTAKALGADTLITGEAKHEHFVKAADIGMNLIALGHFESENIVVDSLGDMLSGYVATVKDQRKQLVKRR